MFDINGGEFIVLALLAALLLGPDRLPEIARQAARLIRRGRDYATGASAQMRDEMGVDLDGVDWKRYDPRQYHPRRIVQNALSDAFEDEDGAKSKSAARSGSTKAGAATSAAKRAEAAATRPSSVRASKATPQSSPSRDSARSASQTTPRPPSPPPTTWADAARHAGLDDDAT